MRHHRRIFIFMILFITVNMSMYADFGEIFGGKFLLLLNYAGIWLWNLVPPTAFYLMYLKGVPFLKSMLLKVTLILSGVALILHPLAFQVGMLFTKISGNASSNSGFAYIYMPAVALLLGLIPGLAYLILLEKQEMREREN